MRVHRTCGEPNEIEVTAAPRSFCRIPLLSGRTYDRCGSAASTQPLSTSYGRDKNNESQPQPPDFDRLRALGSNRWGWKLRCQRSMKWIDAFRRQANESIKDVRARGALRRVLGMEAAVILLFCHSATLSFCHSVIL